MICQRCNIEITRARNNLCFDCDDYVTKQEEYNFMKMFGSSKLFVFFHIYQQSGISYKQLNKSIRFMTDGSLASHLLQLEKLNLIMVKKDFLNKRTHTTYYITETGYEYINKVRDIFDKYMNRRY